MSYTINKTDGSILTVVEDGTLDETTDLKLIGKNYSNFGEVFNENLIALLENFKGSSAPPKPLEGQIWYDAGLQRITVYNGSIFKAIAVLRVATTEPTDKTAGDLWYDSTNQQVYVGNGLTYNLIGPLWTSSQGLSGTVIETVTDDTGLQNVVLAFKRSGTTIAYLSSSTFTPAVAITGFTQIKAGLTFSSNFSAMKFQGTATNADEVDSLDSTQFMRLDLANTASGELRIANDAGITLGSNALTTLNVQSEDLVITNNSVNKDIIFKAKDSSTVNTLLTLDGSSGNVTIANTLTVGTINVSDDLTVSDALTANTITGTLQTAAQPNITSLGTLSSLNVSGGITSGTVVTATTLAGELTTAAQPNITSLGTLTALSVNGTASVTTLNATSISGTLTSPTQTNINQLGVLSGLQVSGSATFNNGINVASGVISGTIGTAAQTNITSVGSLTGLTVSGSATINSLSLTSDLAITEGGTGASTAAGARTNLGAVNIAGDTMTGYLTLVGVPTATNHAATKGYTDSAISGSLTNYATKTYANDTAKWQGANKFVSTSSPTSGDGQDGDIWFVREA